MLKEVCRRIEDYLKDLYGIEVSPSLVSRVTEKIMPMVTKWQSSPLERIYTVAYPDAIHFRVRHEQPEVDYAPF